MANLDKLPAKDQPIGLVCAPGYRGGLAMPALRMMGWENVSNLNGGMGAWKAAKLPVAGWVDWQTVWSEYLAALPEGFYTVKAADLNTQMVEAAPFLLDVRDAAELEADGYIAGAVHIPVKELFKNLDKLPALDQPIVVYCASGHRGGMAMAALQVLGYTDVKDLAGGIGAWKKAELPVETGAPEAPAAGTAPEVDPTRLRDLDAFFSALPEGYFTGQSRRPEHRAGLRDQAAGGRPAHRRRMGHWLHRRLRTYADQHSARRHDPAAREGGPGRAHLPVRAPRRDRPAGPAHAGLDGSPQPGWWNWRLGSG